MKPFVQSCIASVFLLVGLLAQSVLADCSCRTTGICDCVSCSCPAALSPQFVSQIAPRQESEQARLLQQDENRLRGGPDEVGNENRPSQPLGHHNPQHTEQQKYQQAPQAPMKHQQAPQQAPMKQIQAQIPQGAVRCATCDAGYAYVNSNNGACASYGGYGNYGRNGGPGQKVLGVLKRIIHPFGGRAGRGGRGGGCAAGC